MKKMKRLAALFLAVVMIMAMGMTAMAAGTSSIKIKGAIDGATYTAYKIFNVETATKNVEGKDVVIGYSYTRPVKDSEDKDVVKLGTTDYFTEVDHGSDKIYYTPAENLTDSALAEYLGSLDLNAIVWEKPVTATGANGVAELTNLSDGYYYVTSSQGNVAMLRAVGGETVITEKNSSSEWGDNGGKKSYGVDAQGNRTTEEHFFAIGETIEYEVVYEKAYNFIKEKENDKDVTKKVFEYNAEDTMPDGIKLVEDSVQVTVTENGKTTATATPEGATPTITYNKDTDGKFDGTGFEVKIPWAKTNTVNPDNEATAEDFYYKDVPAKITITYRATVTADVNSTGEAMTNRARVTYNGNPYKDNDPKGDNDVYTGTLKIQKYDNSNNGGKYTEALALPGATFKIYKVEGEGTSAKELYLDYDADGKIIWVDEADAEQFTTTEDNKGVLEIKGLDLGTYYAKETVAPAGYNLLAAPVTMTISGTVGTDGKLVTGTAHLVDTQDVGNSTGAVLPSTGGIGTTIFYVVGGILVLGAAVLLITKKRMSARN